MIVQSEITTLLEKADNCYLELIRRYITQARLANDVISIFARLNVLKSCRKALRVYDLANPQIDEVAFNHIGDIIRGICMRLQESGGITELSLSDNLTNGDDPNGNTNTQTMDWLYHSFAATLEAQSSFTGLPFNISEVDPEALRFTVNGESMIYGVNDNYHIIGSTIHWHNLRLNISPTDILRIAYYKL